MNSSPPATEGRSVSVSFGLLLIVLGGAVLFFSRDIQHRLGNNHDPGPQAFPAALSVCLIIGGGVELVRALWHRAKHLGIPESEERPSAPAGGAKGGLTEGKPRNWTTVFVGVALLVYLPAMSWIGFSLSTLLFASGLMWRLGTRAWLSVGMSLLMVIAIHLLFVRLFKVQLPTGVLGLPF